MLAGGAVAAKDRKVETDEIAEVVDEAAAVLKELTTSGSVSRSVADEQLKAARNVTGHDNPCACSFESSYYTVRYHSFS